MLKMLRKAINRTANMNTATKKPDTADSTHHDIRLKVKNGMFQWIRSDDQLVSPLFNTKEAALYFRSKIPFLTDEQWKESLPMTECCANSKQEKWNLPTS